MAFRFLYPTSKVQENQALSPVETRGQSRAIASPFLQQGHWNLLGCHPREGEFRKKKLVGKTRPNISDLFQDSPIFFTVWYQFPRPISKECPNVSESF